MSKGWFTDYVLCQAEDGLLDLMPKLMHGLPESVTYTYLADYM